MTVLVAKKRKSITFVSGDVYWAKMALKNAYINTFWDNGFLIIELNKNDVDKFKKVVKRRKELKVVHEAKNTWNASVWCQRYWDKKNNK